MTVTNSYNSNRTDLKLHDPEAPMNTVYLREYHHRYLHALATAWEGGLTDLELALKTGGSSADVSKKPRLDLVRMGYVEDSGGRRKTRGRSTSTVWRITELGRQKSLELFNTNNNEGEK